MDKDKNKNKGKHAFLIKGMVGLFIIYEENPTKALSSFWANEIPFRNCFITHDELMKRGYTAMNTTEHGQVFELLPGEKI